MLVLTRKKQQTVVVGGDGVHQLLKVTVLEIGPGKVRLGFDVDANVPVHRLEIWERMRANGELNEPKAGSTPARDMPGGQVVCITFHSTRTV